MTFQVGNFKDAMAQKRAALEAAKVKAIGSKPAEAALTRYISPAECSDRIRIVFDDSGSMGSQLQNAKRGVVEFLRNCIPNQTAVAVHFMNTKTWNTALRSDLPQLAMDVEESSLTSGGTPFFKTLLNALREAPQLTRLVAFTDGSPTDQLDADGKVELQTSSWSNRSTWIASADVVIKAAKALAPAVPIDTVFFGDPSWAAKEVELLKYLSEATGGFFLAFDPQKMDFAKGFKYLAPVNRLRLTDGNFRAALERGEVK